MSINSLCNTTATLKTRSVAATTGGGHAASFTPSDPFPCSLQPASGRVVSELARLGMQVNYILYTPTQLTPKANDVVVSGGKNYLVQSCGDAAGRGRMFVMYLLRKDGQ